EIGVWTGEFQAWNDRLLKRQAKLQAAWKVALGEAKQQNVAEADFEAFWLKARAKALAQ
ncbi:MAG: C4-dicarboxylate ABC transporter substrate-binding protein, partial [Candidatus Lambdaproteobacteria bacterium]|nr:C4-dicarboxylate ABC transporter substrate-binding protein [Candidatus Lambdaproteobacteria bacterium]